MLVATVISTDYAKPVTVNVLLNRLFELGAITHWMIVVEVGLRLFHNLLLRTTVEMF